MKYWMRIWDKVDIGDIEKALLVVGIYKAECFSCHNIDLNKDVMSCPYCKVQFRYVSFRDKKVTSSELDRYYSRGLKIIEWGDFLKEYKRQKARKFLGSS
ncbi:MAG: hypothetical protein J7J25_02785 [Candidatus Omnitrophica bacterium]|nr:hypothetical protein [Candidatus Omnitrophota bacterium]